MTQKLVGILQPGYLPWLGFFEQLARVDVFVLYDDVQFDKNGWRNRNRIRAGLEPLWLTVPVKSSGKPLVNQVEVVSGDWAQRQIKTLRQYYGKADCYRQYADELFDLLARPWQRLLDLDVALLEWLVHKLGIATPMVLSSDLGVAGGRDERLIQMVKKLGGTHFYEGAAGRDYIDTAFYRSKGVEVLFQDYRHPEYKQVGEGFVSHLSVIDLLLNRGASSLEIILGKGA